ncbi:hypothetical protein D3C71_1990250 [compost metagenome]
MKVWNVVRIVVIVRVGLLVYHDDRPVRGLSEFTKHVGLFAELAVANSANQFNPAHAATSSAFSRKER